MPAMNGVSINNGTRWLLGLLLTAACIGFATGHTHAEAPVLQTPPAEQTEPTPAETDEQQTAPNENDPAEAANGPDLEGELAILLENTWLQWLLLLVAIFVGLLVGKIAQSGLHRVGESMECRGWAARGEFFLDAASPAKLLIFSIALWFGLLQLTLGELLTAGAAKAMQLLIWIAVFWYLFNLVALIEKVLRRITENTESKLDEQLVPIIRKSLRVFLVVVAVLFIASNVFEQNIGAWLAGFGIAGLAVSLAAQDSLKNLFGSITILLDKPYAVGERINYGGYDGIVEEIGFRSTKVRTLTGHLVTIPNSVIVNDSVENIAKRPTIRRILNVTITYDTPPEKVRHAVQLIRDILQEEGIREAIHPVVKGDELPPRVHFNDFNAASLNIFVIYWFTPPAWWDFLAHAELVNMRIFEEFEKHDIDFAFPTQTIHLANDTKRQLALRMLDANSDTTTNGGM